MLNYTYSLNRIFSESSSDTYRCYKHMQYVGRSIKTVPGYCCADIANYGLGYVQIVGLKYPLYTFIISGLTDWFTDDIVGLKLKDIEQRVTKIRNELSNDEIYRLATTGDEDEYDWIELVRAYEPGWLWTPEITTGNIGESIVNIPVDMELVDGKDLGKVIKLANELGFDTVESLLHQAKQNGAPYDIQQIKYELNRS